MENIEGIRRECFYVVAEGVASTEIIDRIYYKARDTKIGLCRVMEQVVFDVVLQIEECYAEFFPNLLWAQRKLLRAMIVENRLGIKTGHGFYDYSASREDITSK